MSTCLAGFVAVAGMVVFTATPAAASTSIFTSSPASPLSIGSSYVELNWTFALGVGADDASCEIEYNGSDEASVPCNLSGPVSPTGSVSYQATAAGNYALAVTPSLLGVNQPASVSSLVAVKPAPPAITGPSSPGADPSPNWTFTSADPTATASCSLADNHGNTVARTAPCAGTYTAPDLHNVSPAPASGSTTTYTLTVTLTDTGQSSAASSSYDFVTSPGAPTVAATKSIGNGRRPGFTVSGLAANATPACTLTDPHGADITASAVSSCGASPAINLAGEPDGSYTLTVSQQNLAGTSASGSDSYQLDSSPPAAPRLNPANLAGNLRHPLFAVSNLEPNATLTCTISGASPVSVSQCNAAGVVANLATPAADGRYLIDVTATDQAGNTSGQASAVYELDTVAPVAPIVTIASASPSSSRTPIWYWQSGRDDTDTANETASCRIANASGWTYVYPTCPPAFANVVTPTLGPDSGYDGTYTFTVTLTDEAGNPTSVSTNYVVDSTVPEGPTVFIVSPRSGAGTLRHPQWRVSGPDGSSLSCELRRGDGTNGSLVSGASPCDGLVTYNLVGLADGEYSLVVRATDHAGNVSSAKSALYILAPPVPDVASPDSQNPTASWTISDVNPSDRLSCTMSRGAILVAGPGRCGSHPTYDMRQLPPGTYTLSVVQIGPEDVRSAPGTAAWSWAGVIRTSPGSGTTGGTGPAPGGSPGGGFRPNRGKSHVEPSGSSLGGVIRRVIVAVGRHPLGPVLPLPPLFHYPSAHPNQLGEGFANSISSVATAIAGAGGGTGFPLLLLALVLGFLLVQNRIDRQDPKLAFASAAADDLVEFAPPPSWKERL